MNKVALGIIITVVAVAAVGSIMVINHKDSTSTASKPSTSQTSPTASPSPSSRMSDGEMPTPPPSNGSSSTVAETSKVTIQNFAFSPATIKVKKGTTVTWTNQDDAHHTVTPDSPSDAFKAGPLLAKGESYSFTFNTVGTYAYHCEPHPYMKATVEVTE